MESLLHGAGSQHQDLSELAGDSKPPQDLSEEMNEGIKLTDFSEQDEDSRSQEPNKQSKGGIQIHLETSEQHSWEERDNSMTPISGSWEKTSTNLEDASSSLAPELSVSSHLGFLSSDTKDTQDLAWRDGSQEIPELLSEYEALPLSLWEKKTWTEWKFKRPDHPVPKQKPSFHTYCCNSAIEETIKHSPLKLKKASCLRGFIQKQQAPKFKSSEVLSPERMQKQRISVNLKRKKDSKAHSHMTSCEGSGSHLERRSGALYNLYTTFCDEEEADPVFLQRVEGSPTASGVTRACSVFSNLKKGKINVSNLLLTLHTLGILMTRADMHQALKYITVDERGNLNFLNFLNVVSVTTTHFAGTKALQKVRQAFGKLKKDMVAVEDLEPTLECLGVTLSPTIIEQALGCVQFTREGKLNISHFLSTVRVLQSHCDKTALLDEYSILNGRSFGDVNDMDNSELRCRRTCSLDRKIPAHRIPMIMFCNVEEAIAFTELQKQKSKSQRPVDSKRPSTASPVCLAEEKKKKKDIIKWPKIHLGFGYTSWDTLFPLESTLCLKETGSVPVQQTENQSGKDSPSLLSQPNTSAEVNKRKKKRLSFSADFPKRYSVEDSRIPSAS